MGNTNAAVQLVKKMETRRMEVGVVVWTEGVELFEKMVDPDVKTYTILVDSLCKEGEVEKAAKMVELMIEKGVKPDVVTYSALVDGYCLQWKLEYAKDVFYGLTSNGIKPNTRIYNILIDGLFRGQGLVHNNDVSKAIEVLHEMVGKGFSADAWTVEILINLVEDKKLDKSVINGITQVSHK
ncbi:putative pentatricopeptide repeat-containing protein [Tanacetum coccineum]